MEAETSHHIKKLSESNSLSQKDLCKTCFHTFSYSQLLKLLCMKALSSGSMATAFSNMNLGFSFPPLYVALKNVPFSSLPQFVFKI